MPNNGWIELENKTGSIDLDPEEDNFKGEPGIKIIQNNRKKNSWLFRPYH